MTEKSDNNGSVVDGVKSNEDVIGDLVKDFEAQDLSANNTDPNLNTAGGDTTKITVDNLEEFEEKTAPDEDEVKEEKPENPFDDFVDEEAMKESDAALNEEEKSNRREQAETLKQNGNQEFKSGHYLKSIGTYTDALRLCPLCYEFDRAILYSNRAASKHKLENKECAIDDCTKAITLHPTYMKPLLRRAKLYEDIDKLDESLEDYKKIETLDQTNMEVRRNIGELSRRIEERNEKMKEEMLGKLKDLGNMILKPFGLSTNNFELNQDPNGGGYSINFKQNK